MDDAVGNIKEALFVSPMYNNSIVIYSSDSRFMFKWVSFLHYLTFTLASQMVALDTYRITGLCVAPNLVF